MLSLRMLDETALKVFAMVLSAQLAYKCEGLLVFLSNLTITHQYLIKDSK